MYVPLMCSRVKSLCTPAAQELILSQKVVDDYIDKYAQVHARSLDVNGKHKMTVNYKEIIWVSSNLKLV